MKRILMPLLAALAAALLPSCIKQHSTIILNKDGSGTLTEDIYLGPEAIRAVGGANPNETVNFLFSVAQATERAKILGEGVTVDKVEPYSKESGRGARMTYKFTDINKLKFSSPGDEIKRGIAAKVTGEAIKPPKKPTTFAFANGTLTITNPYETAPMAEGKDVPPAADDGSEAAVKTLAGDWATSLKVVLAPGIAETNATHVADNTITLNDVGVAGILENPGLFAKLQAAKDDTNVIMGLLKNAKNVKVEPQTTVTAKLK